MHQNIHFYQIHIINIYKLLSINIINLPKKFLPFHSVNKGKNLVHTTYQCCTLPFTFIPDIHIYELPVTLRHYKIPYDPLRAEKASC